MSKIVQWKRGTTAENGTYVGAEGEITVNTETWGLHVHDGVTSGGWQAVGPQGPAGVDGINGIDGLPGAEGPQGPQGPAGADGTNGTDGLGFSTSVPTVAEGQAGDVTGMVSIDASYIYYCTADYDGITAIWTRTPLSTTW